MTKERVGWTDDQRGRWGHFDSVAGVIAGLASTLFAIVFGLNPLQLNQPRFSAYDEFETAVAAALLLVCVIMAVISLVFIDTLDKYELKVWLVKGSVIPMIVSMVILLLIMFF